MAHTKQWTCRDGTKVRICDMGDGHLLNTLWMLRRSHEANLCAAYSASTTVQGEQAGYSIDDDINRMEDVASDHPLYDDMDAEARERGLVE